MFIQLLSSFYFQIVILAFTLTALALPYYIFILPKQKMAFYTKQGIPAFFSPILGVIRKYRDDQAKDGDYLKEPKSSSKVDPDQKALVTNWGSQVLVSFRDPKYAKDILQHPMRYKKSKVFDIFKHILGTGLSFLEGDEWKTRRKIISSCFHYEFLKNNTPLIQETVKEALEKIPPEEYGECSIMDRLQQITGEVVGRIFFGRFLNRYTLDGMPLTLALADLMGDIGSIVKSAPYMLLGTKALLLPIPKYREIKRRAQAIRDQCYKIIEGRKKETGKYQDLLDALLAERQSGEPNEGLSDEDITDEFITFFLAGMDTTGHLVTMVLYYLEKNPEFLEKINQERENIYDTEKNLKIDALQSMDHLTSAVKETLRIATPVPWILMRDTLEDHSVGDMKIKKGTLIKCEFYPSFYSSKYFEDPEEFKPERWMDTQNKIDPFAFIPFSAGSRNCIGQHLAVLEAKIIISEFLEKFDFKLPEDYKMKTGLRFLYEPLDPLKFILTPKT